MTERAAEPLADPSRDRFADALDRERLAVYDGNALAAVGGQAVAGALLVAVLWGRVGAGGLLAWLAVLSGALGARLAVWHAQRRAGSSPAAARADPAPALRRVRWAVIGTGAAWGSTALLVFPAADLHGQVFLVFILTSMCAGSLTLTAFDLAVASAFVALTLLPIGLRLVTSGSPEAVGMGAIVPVFVAVLAMIGRRAQRYVRDSLQARLADADRAQALLAGQRRLQELSDQLGRKSEALEVTLASMDQGILSLGADGRLNFHNRRLAELLDLPAAFLETRPTMEQIARYQQEHGHYGPALGHFVDPGGRAALERWLEGDRRPFPQTYHRRNLAGRMLEVKTRYLDGGAMVRTFTDVTAYFDAEQRLRDSQAQQSKLALVAAHTDNAVVITDAEDRVEWVNAAFTRMTGHALPDAAGRRLSELLRGPGADLDALARMDEQLRREQKSAAELRYQLKDGRSLWLAVETHAVLGPDGRVQQYISIGRDVTERHAVEQQLRAARDEAERASRTKSEFLSAMSHELRTPMNAILGFAQLMQSDPDRALSARQHAHLQQILRAGAHLLELIDDVLDLARVEAGRQPITIEPVQPSQLLEECLTLMRPLAEERRVRFDGCAPGCCSDPVAADRTRLKQVLLNLLSNAIKYNEPGGSVTVACRPDGDDALVLAVTDSGPGLHPAQQERLFQAFERLGAEQGAVRGAGIGLALSKRLVELMGGQIGVESAPGAGSTFWLRLPRASSAPAAVSPPAALGDAARAAAPDGQCTVLYVEDNPVNVVLMEALLEREPGVRLVTAQLPELGLELAHSASPDLILLDIQLPGMDGYEVLRRLRASERHARTPIVAISANAMRGDIERGLGAGFDAYLTKPLDIAQLLGVVRSVKHA